GIPHEVAVAALSAVNECMELHKENTGFGGLGTKYMNWLLLHVRGALHRLGRLEFEIKTFGASVRVYKSCTDGRLQMILDKGVVEANGKLTGIPVDASGEGGRQPISLELSEWELELRPGDDVLSVHIPRTGKLLPEQCDESFDMAKKFYAAYYPERKFKAFY